MKSKEQIENLKRKIDEKLLTKELIGLNRWTYMCWQAAIEYVLQGDLNDVIE